MYLCICVRICHRHFLLRMKPSAVLYPSMYIMFVAMLESWTQGCFLMISLVAGTGEGGEEEGGEEEGGEEGEKRL